ncbi:hypothetical protein BDA99DRAFT_555206 [Phascolomyces articulosus]|uniref:Uncharacterized protein n=1 Tax=Phascolomyces articulosus TaxID=60185 RepID=A0AAD5PLU3_9FUNG|nr:hypothetical protein BDA99DRAFT_555206 [Phascolomyces articulosus]
MPSSLVFQKRRQAKDLKKSFIGNNIRVVHKVDKVDIYVGKIRLQVIFDIGFDFYNSSSTTPLTGLWHATGPGSSFGGHTEFLKKFLGENPIFPSNFRLDQFANFKTISGFQYTTTNASRSIIPGLVKLVVYNKIKQPFYNRYNTNFRFGKDLNVDSLFKNNSTYARYKSFVKSTCNLLESQPYGTRLEIRCTADQVIANLADIEELVGECAAFIYWEETKIIASFWKLYQDTIDATAAQFLLNQGNSLYLPNRLSVFPILAFLGSSLFSRPPSHYMWKNTQELISSSACLTSGLILLPD